MATMKTVTKPKTKSDATTDGTKQRLAGTEERIHTRQYLRMRLDDNPSSPSSMMREGKLTLQENSYGKTGLNLAPPQKILNLPQ